MFVNNYLLEIVGNMTKDEAVHQFVDRGFSSIPQEWVKIVAEKYNSGIYAWPMWGTMWFVSFNPWGEKLMNSSAVQQGDDEKAPHYDEEMAGANCILDKDGDETCVFIYEIEGEYLIGINGAGWNFYDGAWDKLYDLLGLEWHDKEPVNSTCSQCGKSDDLLTAFTANPICGKCTKKNHKKVVEK
jgi:hypothetical protein